MSIELIRSRSREELISLLQANSSNISKSLRDLGFNYLDTRAQKALRTLIDEEPALQQARQPRLSYLKETYPNLPDLVKSSFAWVEVLEKLQLTNHGSNYEMIQRLTRELKISTAHFDQKKSRFNRPRCKTLEEILQVLAPGTRVTGLKLLVLKHKLLEYRCAWCGNEGIHRGESLTLQLDHINGICNDNRIENLRFLCPNCHTQTPTHSSKGKEKKKKDRKENGRT